MAGPIAPRMPRHSSPIVGSIVGSEDHGRAAPEPLDSRSSHRSELRHRPSTPRCVSGRDRGRHRRGIVPKCGPSGVALVRRRAVRLPGVGHGPRNSAESGKETGSAELAKAERDDRAAVGDRRACSRRRGQRRPRRRRPGYNRCRARDAPACSASPGGPATRRRRSSRARYRLRAVQGWRRIPGAGSRRARSSRGCLNLSVSWFT
jgi:hypothetical protein